MLSSPEDPCGFCQKKLDDFKIEPGCENCPFNKASDKDLEAWGLYQAINSQFVYDFQALPLVFEVKNIQCTRREAEELLEKLSIIHDLVTKHNKTQST